MARSLRLSERSFISRIQFPVLPFVLRGMLTVSPVSLQVFAVPPRELALSTVFYFPLIARLPHKYHDEKSQFRVG